MSETAIGWASHTWNPYDWKCDQISPGCKNCYAKARAEKFYGPGAFAGPPTWQPHKARKILSRREFPPGSVIFVNSHSDTYHEGVPARYIHAIHNIAAYERPDCVFLLLTKRPERVYGLRQQLAWPRNLWLGASVENEDYLWRLDYLLEIPAAGHFASAEPLLGPLPSLERYLHLDWKRLPEHLPKKRTRNLGPPHWRPVARLRQRSLRWVIAGGESGAGYRPFDKASSRSIRDMCRQWEVPFMFKQGSGFHPGGDRDLDDRTWDEVPAFEYEKPAAEPVQMAMF